MDWSRSGYLAPRHRKYLDGEYDFSEHSNPSQFWNEIRDRYTGARLDDALFAKSELVTDEELLKANTPPPPLGSFDGAMLTEDAIHRSMESSKAQASSVGLDGEGLEEDLEKMVEMWRSQAESIEGNSNDEMRRSFERLLVLGMVEAMESLVPPEVNKKEHFKDLIEGGWPDKDRALEIVEKEVSDE